MARVSVPLLADSLSARLPVIGLVGHYPTNNLIGNRPIPKRISLLKEILFFANRRWQKTSGISPGFPGLCLSLGFVIYFVLTRLPLIIILFQVAPT